MNTMTHSAPAWAVTHTDFPAGEYDAEAVTRWEGEALAFEVETPPNPYSCRPSLVRLETEAFGDGPASVIIDLSELPADAEDEYRLTLDGLDQLIHRLGEYRDELRNSTAGLEGRA